MTTTRAPTTVRALLALLQAFGPAVEGEELVFFGDLPEDLDAVVSILHTGIRAALTSRQWWGSANWSAVRPRVDALDLDQPIPPWCCLLCVEGDAKWDRLAASDRLEHPELFVPLNAKVDAESDRFANSDRLEHPALFESR